MKQIIEEYGISVVLIVIGIAVIKVLSRVFNIF